MERKGYVLKYTNIFLTLTMNDLNNFQIIKQFLPNKNYSYTNKNKNLVKYITAKILEINDYHTIMPKTMYFGRH